MEINLWLNRGWVIIPTERRGIVLLGKKTIRWRDRVLLWLGGIGLVMGLEGIPFAAQLGAIFLIVAGWDYWRNTSPPTMFFPEPGETPRAMHR